MAVPIGGYTAYPGAPMPQANGTGPLPGETWEQYQYRLYTEQRYRDQQAEGRAYSDWQQAEARAYGDYQNADARAYGQYINADSRAYGEAQQADSRAYGEARQAQSDAERNMQQAMNMQIQLAQQEAMAESNLLRGRVGLADRQASSTARGRQPIGGITQAYKQMLGGY